MAVSKNGTRSRDGLGEGAPIVLVHGGLGDGEVSWFFMLPFLVEHFTCFLMSTRGRGLSGDTAVHSRERQFEDVAAFVESIGEPIGVFGHSSGAVWALSGAAISPAHVRALALYEPLFPALEPPMSDEQYERVRAAITEGRLADAVQITTGEIVGLSAEEQALFSAPDVAERAQAALPVVVQELPEVNRPSRTLCSRSSRCGCSLSSGSVRVSSSSMLRATSASGSPTPASLRSPPLATLAR